MRDGPNLYISYMSFSLPLTYTHYLIDLNIFSSFSNLASDYSSCGEKVVASLKKLSLSAQWNHLYTQDRLQHNAETSF